MFVRELLKARTEWCIAMCQKAASLGVDLIVIGDDAGHRGGPMIPSKMWRELLLPYHRSIVEELAIPVTWHTDGAIEAGFWGVHGLEPAAGIGLGKVKRAFEKNQGLRWRLYAFKLQSRLQGHESCIDR